MPAANAPIDQLWIKAQCDKLVEGVKGLPEDNKMRSAVLMRVHYYLDLVEAWQNRKED